MVFTYTHIQAVLKKAIALVLALSLCLNNVALHRAEAITYDSATTEYFETIDDYGLASGSDNIGLRFGGTLNEYLRFNQTIGRFVLTDDLDVQGTLSGSALTIMHSTSYILGNVGVGSSATPQAQLEVVGTISGAALKITGNAAISGALVLEGGTTLSGSAIRGFGLLTDCDNATDSKLLWDSTSGRFSCGADQAAESGSSGGISQTDGDQRYVNVAGDTMTGVLAVQNGNTHSPTGTALINTRGTVSGVTLYANTALRSSGSLVVEGNSIIGDTDADNISFFGDINTTVNPDANNTYDFGNSSNRWKDGYFVSLNLSGNISGVTGISASGDINTSANVNAANLNASNNVTAQNGAFTSNVSAVNLNITGNSILGSDGEDSISLAGDVNTNVNPDANNTYDFGNSSNRWKEGFFVGLNLSGNIAAVTGITASGDINTSANVNAANLNASNNVTAQNGAFTSNVSAVNLNLTGNGNMGDDTGDTFTFAGPSVFNHTLQFGDAIGDTITVNSGTWTFNNDTIFNMDGSRLTIRGTLSGANVIATSSFSGAGLVDCDADNQTLAWDATTGRFSCGDDDGGSATGWTDDGAVVRLDTVGDSVGVGTAAPKARFAVQGTMSGISLIATSSFSGAGLTDCDEPTDSKLLWNASTGRFSCGADQSAAAGGSSGISQGAADNRFVNQSGDTMTGRLLIRPDPNSALVTSGALTILAVKESQTGALIYASGAAVLALQVPWRDASLSAKHIVFGGGENASFDTNLYRNSVASLKTDGSFEANTLNGTTVNAFTSLVSFGATQLGDNITDTVSVGAGAWTFSNDTNFILNGGSGGLAFDTDTVWIDAEANEVGIGTAYPEYKLDVNGTLRSNNLAFFGNTSTHAGIRLTAGTSTNSYIDFYENTTKSAALYWGGATDTFIINDTGVGNTTINPSAGNVGVRASSPKANFAVGGSVSGVTLAGFNLSDCDNATTSKLLYDITTGQFSCGTDQSGSGGAGLTRIAGSSGAAGADMTWQNLTSNTSDCTTTALCTIMTTTGVGVGTWKFKYTIIYQSDVTTTGIGFGIGHTGTTGQYQAMWWHAATTTSNIGDNDTSTVLQGVINGKHEGVINVLIGSQASGVAVVDTDILAVLEGILEVTGSGDLQLAISSEIGGTAVRVMADSTLELVKIE